uniref:Uncharacterized protein n=1 Tax=Pseudomonas phage RVTF4 TaxID=3236931 RepID=A0AB39CD77_9VIRU
MSRFTVKLGPVSYNVNTGKVNFDRRTIKGQALWKHLAYAAAGTICTIALAKALQD